MITGYPIPGSTRGQAFTLPDFCYGKVTEEDAERIAAGLRAKQHAEPHWQKVRGALIKLAKRKGGAA